MIMVFLAGGPPHLDMFDLKPDAPAGIRGEYKPIPTNVPGLDICEHMPRLARMMDKFTVIRSLVGDGPDHSAGQCLRDIRTSISKAQGGRPSLGAIVSKLPGSRSTRRAAVRRALSANRRDPLGKPRRPRIPRPGSRAVHAVPDRDCGASQSETSCNRLGGPESG